jgi:predicted GNAT family acetyltransferase
MPEALVALGFVDVGEFWAPWCVALEGDEIASIAFAARLGPAGAETGVATVPALRGRGFAAAATAGWASLPALDGRTLFYSTSRTNLSSQRVAQRLGLRFIGATFSIA